MLCCGFATDVSPGPLSWRRNEMLRNPRGRPALIIRTTIQVMLCLIENGFELSGCRLDFRPLLSIATYGLLPVGCNPYIVLTWSRPSVVQCMALSMHWCSPSCKKLKVCFVIYHHSKNVDHGCLHASMIQMSRHTCMHLLGCYIHSSCSCPYMPSKHADVVCIGGNMHHMTDEYCSASTTVCWTGLCGTKPLEHYDNYSGSKTTKTLTYNPPQQLLESMLNSPELIWKHKLIICQLSFSCVFLMLLYCLASICVWLVGRSGNAPTRFLQVSFKANNRKPPKPFKNRSPCSMCVMITNPPQQDFNKHMVEHMHYTYVYNV